MRGAAGFRGVRAWLEAIMRRRVVATWRARRARPQLLLDEAPDGARQQDDVAGQVEVGMVLRGLLAELPEEQRDAVWCVDVLELPVAEAAELLRVPRVTIKSRCIRGRERLRTVLVST